MYPNGLMKAVTFSYDDGINQDKRLVALLNKYNLKATFNLNSGVQTGASFWQYKGVEARRMNLSGLKELYEGHEIAVHCLTHAELDKCDAETVYNELMTDKENHERIHGKPVRGMAYPCGTYDEQAVRIIRECGFSYGRTASESLSFDIPENLLTYTGTCHHNNPHLFEFAEEFASLKPEMPKVFFIWGHSYEFDADNTWDRMEKFCVFISGRDDIYYCNNYQALCLL